MVVIAKVRGFQRGVVHCRIRLRGGVGADAVDDHRCFKLAQAVEVQFQPLQRKGFRGRIELVVDAEIGAHRVDAGHLFQIETAGIRSGGDAIELDLGEERRLLLFDRVEIEAFDRDRLDIDRLRLVGLGIARRWRGDDHALKDEAVVAQCLAALVGQRAGWDLRLDRFLEAGEAIGENRACRQESKPDAGDREADHPRPCHCNLMS